MADKAENETPQPGDEMDKFQGFSAVDGVVQTPAKEPAPKAPATPVKPAAAKPPVEPEDEDEDDEAGSEDDKHKSAQTRINKAVAKQRAAERRAQAAEQRVTRLEQEFTALRQSLTPQAQQRNVTPKPPDPEDYEGKAYDHRYLAAVARYEAELATSKATQQIRAESAQAAQTQQQQQAQREFDTKKQALFQRGSELYDDFAEIAGDDAVAISPVIAQLSVESEFGAEIIYELAQDFKEQRRVWHMPDAQQAAWFGRKEAALSSKTQDATEDEQPPVKVSKAPPPPSFNARGTGGMPKVSPSTTNFADFERMVEGQQRK